LDESKEEEEEKEEEKETYKDESNNEPRAVQPFVSLPIRLPPLHVPREWPTTTSVSALGTDSFWRLNLDLKLACSLNTYTHVFGMEPYVVAAHFPWVKPASAPSSSLALTQRNGSFMSSECFLDLARTRAFWNSTEPLESWLTSLDSYRDPQSASSPLYTSIRLHALASALMYKSTRTKATRANGGQRSETPLGENPLGEPPTGNGVVRLLWTGVCNGPGTHMLLPLRDALAPVRALRRAWSDSSAVGPPEEEWLHVLRLSHLWDPYPWIVWLLAEGCKALGEGTVSSVSAFHQQLMDYVKRMALIPSLRRFGPSLEAQVKRFSVWAYAMQNDTLSYALHEPCVATLEDALGTPVTNGVELQARCVWLTQLLVALAHVHSGPLQIQMNPLARGIWLVPDTSPEDITHCHYALDATTSIYLPKVKWKGRAVHVALASFDEAHSAVHGIGAHPNHLRAWRDLLMLHRFRETYHVTFSSMRSVYKKVHKEWEKGIDNQLDRFPEPDDIVDATFRHEWELRDGYMHALTKTTAPLSSVTALACLQSPTLQQYFGHAPAGARVLSFSPPRQGFGPNLLETLET
jgi:hypothetical protein